MSGRKGKNIPNDGYGKTLNLENTHRSTSAPFAPTWRSVAMDSTQQSMFSQPSVLSHSSGISHPSASSSSPTTQGKNSLTSTPSDNVWNVCSVSPIPMRYQLDKNCKLVRNMTVNIVAREIAKVNKEMSIHAEYDDENGSAVLFTPDHVEIVVNLFEGNCGGVLVEVQRRAGDSVMFHRYSRCILLASSGEMDVTTVREIVQPDLSLPPLLMEDRAQQKHADEALTITADLLKQGKRDAQILGMEGLTIMTDGTKTSSVVASMCSRALLLNNYDDASRIAIQRKIVEVLQNWNIQNDEHVTFMVNRSLLALSNSLYVMDENGNQEEHQYIYKFLQEEGIVTQLTKILDKVYERPHDAMLSAKSLFILMKFCPNAVHSGIMDDLKPSVEKATEYGEKMHADLARTCGALLKVL